MMKGNVFMRLSLLLLFFVQSLFAVEIGNLNFAVIWNNQIEPYYENIPLGTDIDSASIGKSALKLFLTGLDSKVGYSATGADGVHDTSGIADVCYSESDPVLLSDASVLKNVRIYNCKSMLDEKRLTYNHIVEDFGEAPDAIIYINAGSEWPMFRRDNSGTVLDSNENFQDSLAALMKEASKSGVGILTIGDNAATSAAKMDPDGDVFAVKGVQRIFTFNGYTSDLDAGHKEVISEFDFVDEKDGEVADTVILMPDRNTGKPAMYKIYGVSFDPNSGYNWESEKLLWSDGTVASGVTLAKDAVLKIEGLEWLITAKAVDVISFDTYSPGMNFGVAYRTVWIGYDKDKGTLRIGNPYLETQFPSQSFAPNDYLAFDGVKIAEYKDSKGTDLSTVTELSEIKFKEIASGDTILIEQDVFANVNGQDYLFLPESLKIAKYESGHEKEWVGGRWHQYISGGYDNVSIEVDEKSTVLVGTEDKEFTNSKLFSRIFTSSVTSGQKLEFHPWIKNHRVQAAADVWAINSNAGAADGGQLVQFDKLYDPAEKFDMKNYYYAVLGNQTAEDSRLGGQMFYKNPAALYETKLFSKLPGTAESGTDKKLYHAISAIQHGYNRIMMLGYQPQYLKEAQTSINVTKDAAIWVAVNDVFFPNVEIYPYYDGSKQVDSKVYADLNELYYEMDMSSAGPELLDQGYTVEWEVVYKSTSYKGSKKYGGDPSDDGIRSGTISFADLKNGSGDALAIDNSSSDNAIKVFANIVPADGDPLPAGLFVGSADTADYTIRRLTISSDVASGTDYTGDIDVTFTSEKDTDSDALVSDATITETTTGSSATAKTLTVNVNTVGEVVLKAKATHTKYLDSEEITIRVTKTDVTLPKPDIIPDGSEYTGLQNYFFYGDTTFMITLPEFTIEGENITSDDYNINYSFSGKETYVNGQLEDTGTVEITLAKVQEMIESGETKFWVNAETVPQDPDGAWKASGGVSESYEFRTVSIKSEIIDSTADSVEMIITVWDSTNGWNKELDDASIEYKVNGATGTVTHGTAFKVPAGFITVVNAKRTGYLPASKPFLFVQGTEIVMDTSTSFGDSITFTFNTSVVPYKIEVINEEGTKVVNTEVSVYDTSVTVTDAKLNDLQDKDTAEVTVIVTVETKVDGNGDTLVAGRSDTVVHYHRRLPEVSASPTGAESDAGRYLFDNTDATITLELDDPISESSDYTIYNWLNGVKQDDVSNSGETTVIPLDEVVALIEAKKTGIELTAQAIANNPHGPNSWMNGKTMEKETFEFRSLAVRVERKDSNIGTDFTEKLTFRIVAIDTLDGDREITGTNIITLNDDQVMDSPTEITITGDTVFLAQASKRGWITSENTDTTKFIRKVDLSEGGAYFDADGNGFIDSGWINVDVKIEPESIVCRDPFSDQTITVAGSELYYNPSETRFEFKFDEDADNYTFGTDSEGKINTGFDASRLIYLNGDNYDDSTNVVDSVAPVIRRAQVVPSERSDNSENDLLYIEFSEEMTKVSLGDETPFVLLRGVATKVEPTVTGTVEYISDGTWSGMYRFQITSWGENVTYPRTGNTDSLRIDYNADITDSKGSVQEVELNRKVPLEVEPKPVAVDLVWFWKKKEIDLSSGIEAVSEFVDMAQGSDSTSGVVMLLHDPTSDMGDDQTSEFKVSVTILDQLGNVVASGESEKGAEIYEDNLIANPARFTVIDESNNPSTVLGIAILWTARNKQGRRASGGTYKVLVKSEWPGNATSEVTTLIKAGSTDETVAK